METKNRWRGNVETLIYIVLKIKVQKPQLDK